MATAGETFDAWEWPGQSAETWGRYCRPQLQHGFWFPGGPGLAVNLQGCTTVHRNQSAPAALFSAGLSGSGDRHHVARSDKSG